MKPVDIYLQLILKKNFFEGCIFENTVTFPNNFTLAYIAKCVDLTLFVDTLKLYNSTTPTFPCGQLSQVFAYVCLSARHMSERGGPDSIAVLTNAQRNPEPLFAKRQDVLLPKSRSREIGCYYDRIALKYDRYLSCTPISGWLERS